MFRIVTIVVLRVISERRSEKVETSIVSGLLILSIATIAVWALLQVLVANNVFNWPWFEYTYFSLDGVYGVAVFVLVVADVLFAFVHWHLGKSWSGLVSKMEDHELKTSGPYAWARHPMYVAFFFFVVGVFLGGEELGVRRAAGVQLWRGGVQDQNGRTADAQVVRRCLRAVHEEPRRVLAVEGAGLRRALGRGGGNGRTASQRERVN